jgi:hypothetical protein
VAETRDQQGRSSTGGGRDVDQKLASGRPASTPFALTGIVAIVIWVAAALVAALIFLVIWLA